MWPIIIPHRGRFRSYRIGQAGRQAGRWADRQVGRQAGGQTGRWAGSQEDKHGEQVGRHLILIVTTPTQQLPLLYYLHPTWTKHKVIMCLIALPYAATP